MCKSVEYQYRPAQDLLFDQLPLFIPHTIAFHIIGATLPIQWARSHSWSCYLEFDADVVHVLAMKKHGSSARPAIECWCLDC